MPRFFPSFLVELYSIVRCSVPLMERALERAEQLAAHDELARVTAGYLRLHIEEERHHDEWLLDDLVAAGMDRELLRDSFQAVKQLRDLLRRHFNLNMFS